MLFEPTQLTSALTQSTRLKRSDEQAKSTRLWQHDKPHSFQKMLSCEGRTIKKSVTLPRLSVQILLLELAIIKMQKPINGNERSGEDFNLFLS
ncbi:CLUMA_CG009375, isoform A [Clunio marinus]|uniref:CLUMA_CG009375, isoform A n=1 Tax=Clunio marinus TaxID=568069 RepID=A0A1J1I863_9DIPT|nr:CLUMA_CG009375, isoform A [Clunio marinus]